MEHLSVEQILEKYPYLKGLTKHVLFTSKEDVKQLINSDKVKTSSEEVSIEFLKRVLDNDNYYEYAQRYFDGEISKFQIAHVLNGDISPEGLHYKKTSIMQALEKLISSGQIALNPQEQERYKKLKNNVSFEKFLEKYQKTTYDTNIDGNSYSIPVDEIISLMQLPDEQFDNLLSNEEIKDIYGMPKEYFMYASFNFFRENGIIRNFLMPEIITKHYLDVGSQQKIDIQAINRYLVTNDTKHRGIQINEELEQAIIAGLPKDATDLEKAIYIYIKMCKLLTYDEEYYAVNQSGIAAKKHESTDYVSNITLDNNKVVCFEFNLIYSKLLSKIGINFATDYKNSVEENYGEGHAKLDFRTGKFLVSADSVTSILLGDIMRAKLNQPLVGLNCTNTSQQTQQEFKQTLTKIYQLIANQEKRQKVEHVQTLDELLEEYSHITKNIKSIGLDERLSILINKVNSTGMVGIDSLSYILQLRKILFTEEQRNNNIGFTIIKNNEPFEKDKIAMASGIFTINSQNIEENLDQNIYYYYYNPNHELIPITRDELQAKFSDGVFAYIDKENPKIPGIIEKGGPKK